MESEMILHPKNKWIQVELSFDKKEEELTSAEKGELSAQKGEETKNLAKKKAKEEELKVIILN